METPHIASSWNWLFLALSCLPVWGAALLALDLGQRAHKANGARWGLWWLVQGLILGYTLWALQVVVLLIIGRSAGAAYDLDLILLGGMLAVGSITAALRMAQDACKLVRWAGIALAGAGAYATFQVGVASMVGQPGSATLPGWPMIMSALWCSAALWLFTLVNGQQDVRRGPRGLRVQTLAALGMSVAVTVSHHISLGSGRFSATGDSWLGAIGSGISGLVDATTLSTVVAFATLLILGVTVFSIVMNSDGSEVFQEQGR